MSTGNILLRGALLWQRANHGWVFALGDGAKILEPENVVEQMKELMKKAIEKYQ